MIIVEPDVELVVTEVVRAFLSGRPEEYAQQVKVGRKTPTDIPLRLVTVRSDGGPRIDLARWQPRLGLNAFADSDQNAMDLALLVTAGLEAATDGSPIRKLIRPTTPVRVPEPDDRPHVYWSCELIVKGRET